MVLIGNVGRLYSGYRVAATISHWEAIRANDTINDRVVKCGGRITTIDQFWITQPITRLALRIGRAWWVWNGNIGIEEINEGQTCIAVRAVGEPELVTNLE